MVEETSIFPLEFVVAGTPASHQAKGSSKGRWTKTVGDVARERVCEMVDIAWLDERPVAINIFYFPSSPMVGDIDNIIKPIMDALVGVAFPNDRVVERVVAQKFEPDLDWTFAQPSKVLAVALDTEAPVVYIGLDDTMAWRRN